MRATVYKAVRTAQSAFPGLADRKYAVQRWIRRARKRPFEEDFLALRYFPSTDDSLFLDVGGNRGQSIDAILLTTSGGRIWSFEPNPVLAGKLRAEYSTQPRVKVWGVGLGRAREQHTLYVPAYRGYVYDGLASFDEESAVSWLQDRVYGYRASSLTVQQYVCDSYPLDDFGCAPDFVKIDVQGFEYDVVLGARETITRSNAALLIEAPDKRLTGLLASLGLERYAFDGRRFVRGASGGLNTFFLNAARQEQLAANGAPFA